MREENTISPGCLSPGENSIDTSPSSMNSTLAQSAKERRRDVITGIKKFTSVLKRIPVTTDGLRSIPEKEQARFARSFIAEGKAARFMIPSVLSF